MNRQIIPYATDDEWLAHRVNDLTSTDIPALFSLSPYKTKFELWFEKKNSERGVFVENERMKWGRRLEQTVAQGIADDQGWIVRPMKEYMRLPDRRIGSSFDFRIMRDGSGVPGNETPWPGDEILEIKCVDWLAFRDGWTIDEGFIEAPAHIEIQVQHQMLVSGLRRAYIGVMVGGNDIRVIEREADDAVHAGILTRAAEFWQSIEANTPPDPVMPDDAAAVIAMYQYAEPGKLYDARNDADVASLVQQYHQLGAVERDTKERREVIKAELLMKIGDHEKVLLDGYSVSAGFVGPADIPAYTRSGYRLVRVSQKKAKAA